MSKTDGLRYLGRLVLALGAAAFAAALIPAILSNTLFGLVLLFGSVVAAAHAFMIGLPAYLAFRKAGPLTYPIAALAGFVIGTVPVSVVVLMYSEGGRSGGFEKVAMSSVFGLYGAVGGLAFRAVLGREKQFQ